MNRSRLLRAGIGAGAALLIAGPALAADTVLDMRMPTTGNPVGLFALLTLMGFIPLIVVAMTTFTRNIIVFSLVRQGLGLPQTPPNVVLIMLAFFLALFTMTPTLQKIYDDTGKRFMEGKVPVSVATVESWAPMRDFMLRQTRESDLVLMHKLAEVPLPETPEQVAPTRLIPAFMLSEIKMGFQIGFAILLPFLVIDLVVAAVLMALGMIMVPPTVISLPIKILLFLMIDGWALVAQTLVRSAAG